MVLLLDGLVAAAGAAPRGGALEFYCGFIVSPFVFPDGAFEGLSLRKKYTGRRVSSGLVASPLFGPKWPFWALGQGPFAIQ